MKCGGANLPDAIFCCKCANPFQGVAAAPIRRPAQANQSQAPYERPPAPSLSRRDRDKRRPVNEDESEITEIEASDDDGDGVSLQHVPEIYGLEYEVAPPEGIKKVDIGSLFAENPPASKQRNPKSRRKKK